MTISIIDSSTSLISLLNDLENQPTNPPSLYLDLEGVKLSRHGSISIIQLYHLPQNHVFLIDIFILQEAAFNTSNQSGTTLRSILESALVPKVFFDARNDADALYAHFHISLQGVHDVQLLEVATRSRAKDRVAGLGKCIKYDAGLPAEAQRGWKATKERGKALFAAEDGGSYEVFNIRPMLQDIVDYCAQDVVYLPVLWNVYSRKIGKAWLEKVQEETSKRVSMSRAESYVPHGEHKTLSPWANTAKDRRKKNHSGTTGMREIEKEGTFEVIDAKKRGKLSIAHVATHRKAETQLNANLIRQCPIGDIKPQASKQMVDLITAQETPIAIDIRLERPFPQVDLSTKGKAATHTNAVANVNIETSPAAVNSLWRCTTCSRSMQKTQQPDHLAGKAHTARSKQVPSTISKTLLQPTTTAKEDSLKAATRNQKAKVKSVTKPQQNNPKKVESRDIKRTSGATTISTHQPSRAPYSSSDWGFVGFAQNRSAANIAYGGYHSRGGDDYGLCDKDCGWCGHCMDGVDI